MKKFTLLAVAIVLVLAFALAGCSGATTSSSAPVESSTAPSDSSAAPVESSTAPADSSEAAGTDLADLEALIAKCSELPTFSLEAKTVDAKSIMAGKKVQMVPSNSANAFVTGSCALIQKLCESLGAEAFVWENKGTADEWNTGIQNAINQGYDFVNMYGGCDPGLVASGYALLQEAKIPLMTSHFGKAGNPIETADYRLGMDFTEAGEILAAWTILKGGPEVKVAVLVEFDTESGPLMMEGMKAIYEKYAPNSTVEYITVPLNDWATKAQNETQNAIQRINGLNYVVPLYDSMLQYVVPGIEMAGATGTVKAISYNGTPFALDMIRTGDTVEMIVGESLDWIAYASTDIMIRALGGEEVVSDQKVPHYLFTKENIETAGNPAEYGKGYGDSYVAGYNKLWGLE